MTPEDLSAYGKMLNRASQDAEEGKRYLQQHSDIGSADQGLFTRPFDFHGDLADGAVKALSQLHKIMHSSSEELFRSGTYYESTDQSEAAHMDGLQPESKR